MLPQLLLLFQNGHGYFMSVITFHNEVITPYYILLPVYFITYAPENRDQKKGIWLKLPKKAEYHAQLVSHR